MNRHHYDDIAGVLSRSLPAGRSKCTINATSSLTTSTTCSADNRVEHGVKPSRHSVNQTQNSNNVGDQCMAEHEHECECDISHLGVDDNDEAAIDNQLLDAMTERKDADCACRHDNNRDSASSMDVDACNAGRISAGERHCQLPAARQPPPQRKWIDAIQNASYQPKPTAFSPHGSCEENPLLEQQRQCRDKLEAIARVRQRLQFLPFVETAAVNSATAASITSLTGRRATGRFDPSMQIHTRMILSTLDNDNEGNNAASLGFHISAPAFIATAGIEMLAGLETLFFVFLTPAELLGVSAVCRGWKDMARHNAIWEPLLLTSLEQYPLRSLLGVKPDLPAIQVYMVFKRLRLGELPRELARDVSRRPAPAAAVGGNELRRHHAVQHVRFAEERHRLLTLLRHGAPPARAATDDAAPQLHPPRTLSTARIQRRSSTNHVQPLSAPMRSIHVVGFPSDRITTLAPRIDDDVDLAQDDFGELLADPRARADREGDLHFVKEGYARTSLRLWLQQQPRDYSVSESVLQSLLRQVLLAIATLEQAGATHAAITTANIVVLERVVDKASDATGDTSDSPDATAAVDAIPLFQLDCSRSVTFVGRGEIAPRQQQQQQQQQAAAPPQPPHRLERRFDVLRERRREVQQVAILAAALRDDVELHGDGAMLELAEDMLLRHARSPCMLTSLLRCALRVWSRGRFPDTSIQSSTPLLHLLVLLHVHISPGLRSFIEYGKFLIDVGGASATARQLLRHAFVADPIGSDTIAVRAIHAQDVVDYQASVHAWYSCARAAAQSAVRQQRHTHSVSNSSSSTTENDSVSFNRDDSVSATTRTHALMPRTQMAAAYFAHALQERNLPHERFMSIVAPSVQSSSWIRKVAETQRHTLQRLDLSSVQLPTSVLLQELVHLPHITHLRLPTNIERPDDLEHFVAALACTDLLPRLRAMDANVERAIDRIEQTYRVQLDMVNFLLGQ